MRTNVLAAATLVALCLSATGALAAKIVCEAEKYSSITPSMKKITEATASGHAGIQIPLRRPHATSETGPGDHGNATYKFIAPVAGVYQFWGRAWWYDACGNSFFVTVENHTQYITDQTFGRWHWVAGPTFSLSAGPHTLRIQNREDGARLDEWLLTTTPKVRWEPTRIEKPTM